MCRSDNIISRKKVTYGEQDVQSVYMVLMNIADPRSSAI